MELPVLANGQIAVSGFVFVCFLAESRWEVSTSGYLTRVHRSSSQWPRHGNNLNVG